MNERSEIGTNLGVHPLVTRFHIARLIIGLLLNSAG